MAHYGQRGAGGNLQVDGVEDWATAEVYRHVPELDIAVHRAQAQRFGGRGDRGLLAENLVDALQGCAAALRQVDHPAERNHGPHQHAHVGVEHDEAADGNASGYDLTATYPQHHQERQADERLEQRLEHALDANQADIVRDKGPVQF